MTRRFAESRTAQHFFVHMLLWEKNWILCVQYWRWKIDALEGMIYSRFVKTSSAWNWSRAMDFHLLEIQVGWSAALAVIVARLYAPEEAEGIYTKETDYLRHPCSFVQGMDRAGRLALCSGKADASGSLKSPRYLLPNTKPLWSARPSHQLHKHVVYWPSEYIRARGSA